MNGLGGPRANGVKGDFAVFMLYARRRKVGWWVLGGGLGGGPAIRPLPQGWLVGSHRRARRGRPQEDQAVGEREAASAAKFRRNFPMEILWRFPWEMPGYARVKGRRSNKNYQRSGSSRAFS